MVNWQTVVARHGTVRDAIDHEAAGATDAFAAIVLEGDWLFALFNQTLVEHVEALQHRHLCT